MSKCWILVLYFLFQITFVFGQSSFEWNLNTGTELNIGSSFNPTLINNFEPMPGFNIGCRFQHNYTKRISMWGGMEYSRMYWKKKGVPYGFFPNEFVPYYYLYIGNQVRFPFAFQLNFGNKKSKFHTNIGISFVHTFQDNTRIKGFSFDKIKILALPDFIQQWNMGGFMGVGYSYQFLKKMKFYSELRFIIPLVANPAHTTDLNNSTRNLTISLTAGISFN